MNIALAGTRTANATTSAAGAYSFTSLPSGSYTVTPSMSGLAFDPVSRSVTIGSANVGNVDFVALSAGVIATGIEFLPEWFSSADQLRASLVVRGGYVYFTDSSATPLKRAAIDGSAVSSLADRFRGARNVLVRGGDVYWVDASQLKRAPLAGGATTVLAEGSADHGERTTADIAVDDSYVYWVNSVATPTCSPPCTWVIQKVPLAGGAPVTLVTVNRKVAALAADPTRLVWEESSLESFDPGCNCGSTVKSMPKVGGAITVLVDGGLNGTMPAPPPGQTLGSWLPTGGLALTASEIVFARAGIAYEIMAVPLAGGALRTLASVATPPSYYSSVAVQGLAVSGGTVYFVDNFNHTLSAVPLGGGAVTPLASNLGALSATNASVMVVSAGNAYWGELGTTTGCCIAGGTGAIRRVALTGGAVSTVVSGADMPGSVSLDGANLVWTEAWRIGKAASSGANPATLASGISSDMARIAADATSIYVLDGSFIKKVPLSGGQAEKLAYTSPVLDDLSLIVQDIATDGSSVYWTTAGGPSAPSLRKVGVAGGPVTIIGAGGGFVSPQDCYWRIAVQGGFAYWSSGGTSGPISCAVNRVPTGGGAVTTVIDYPYLADFTVDDSHVYFSDGSPTLAILKVPVSGGATSVVAYNAAGWVMTNYGSRLYWVDLALDTVAWIDKSANGGMPTFVPGGLWLDPYAAFEGITVDANGLYVTETQTGTIYGLD